MVEVGLGGRLDSTNVVRPLVSAVTKIERDHMKYLGDTLEKIAGEKAGIAKPGAPFVIGERDPALVDVLRREARRAVARGAARRAGPTSGCCRRSTSGAGRSASPGPHQRRNAGVAHGDPDGAARALPARRARRSHAGFAQRMDSRPAGPARASGCSTSPTTPTGSAR